MRRTDDIATSNQKYAITVVSATEIYEKGIHILALWQSFGWYSALAQKQLSASCGNCDTTAGFRESDFVQEIVWRSKDICRCSAVKSSKNPPYFNSQSIWPNDFESTSRVVLYTTNITVQQASSWHDLPLPAVMARLPSSPGHDLDLWPLDPGV